MPFLILTNLQRCTKKYLLQKKSLLIIQRPQLLLKLNLKKTAKDHRRLKLWSSLKKRKQRKKSRTKMKRN